MNSLTKSERLHSFGAIRRLFKEGRSGFVYPFRYMVYTEEAPQTEVALLFSTPKKYHKRANKRNALRRRMREAYRLLVKQDFMPENTRWIFIARSGIGGKKVQDVMREMKWACGKFS